jgi:hypothetical protein
LDNETRGGRGGISVDRVRSTLAYETSTAETGDQSKSDRCAPGSAPIDLALSLTAFTSFEGACRLLADGVDIRIIQLML